MSEFDLLYLLNELRNSWTGLVQWWASISFALMLVAHFIGNNLRLPLVIGLLALYTVFSILMYFLQIERIADMGSIISELIAMEASGNLSEVGIRKLQTDGMGPSSRGALGLLLALSVFGTYLAAVIYLLYRYVQAVSIRKTAQEV